MAFRDVINYCGGGSLERFASLYNVPGGKQLFPYEHFTSIAHIRQQKTWPPYRTFFTRLGRSQSYSHELGTIINNFGTFGNLMEYFGFDHSNFHMYSAYLSIPNLTNDQQTIIDNYFTISPIMYMEHKTKYDAKIMSGEYNSFESYLREYNLRLCSLIWLTNNISLPF